MCVCIGVYFGVLCFDLVLFGLVVVGGCCDCCGLVFGGLLVCWLVVFGMDCEFVVCLFVNNVVAFWWCLIV